MNHKKPSLSELFRAVVIGLVLGYVLLYVANTRATRVCGRSMWPTVENGQVLVTVYGDHSPERGDIVTLWVPNPLTGKLEAWLKRVIGLPGDFIEITPLSVVINGKPMSETYAVHPPDGYKPMRVLLSAREYWVMGDNREYSLDSRIIGPVLEDSIDLVHEVWFLVGMGESDD